MVTDLLRGDFKQSQIWTCDFTIHFNTSFTQVINDYDVIKNFLEITKQVGEPVLIANAENTFTEAKERDALEIFKKDLGHFYEFMSQIVEHDDKELEKTQDLYNKIYGLQIQEYAKQIT